MKRSILKSQKGFSLIELMIVVAIIGILAAIAVPNFQRFQAKSRQSEGKGLISGFYTAQKAAYSEWSRYPGNLVAVGFHPEGELTYRLSVGDGAFNPPTGPNDNACTDTSVACSWTEKYTEKTGYAQAVQVCAPATTNTTFIACSTADLVGNGTAGEFDEWEINQNKVIKNSQDGLAAL